VYGQRVAANNVPSEISIQDNTSAGREMSMQPTGGAYESEAVVPFAPAAKNPAADSADQLDNAGQTILRLLHKAAGVAEANSHHAREMAQKLSHQLRGAENRIAELEAEVGIYREMGRGRKGLRLSLTNPERSDWKIKEGNFTLGAISEIRSKIAQACDWADGIRPKGLGRDSRTPGLKSFCDPNRAIVLVGCHYKLDCIVSKRV
jgi:hypothetical protein